LERPQLADGRLNNPGIPLKRNFHNQAAAKRTFAAVLFFGPASQRGLAWKLQFQQGLRAIIHRYLGYIATGDNHSSSSRGRYLAARRFDPY
jgi:hypothetical protein